MWKTIIKKKSVSKLHASGVSNETEGTQFHCDQCHRNYENKMKLNECEHCE